MDGFFGVADELEPVEQADGYQHEAQQHRGPRAPAGGQGPDQQTQAQGDEQGLPDPQDPEKGAVQSPPQGLGEHGLVDDAGVAETAGEVLLPGRRWAADT